MENFTVEKKAYELDGIAIGFIAKPSLGDVIIDKKILEAIIKIEPHCNIDIFCNNDKSYIYAKAFYIGSKNFNRILDSANISQQDISKYDLVLNTHGHAINLNFVNVDRLQNKSPALMQSIVKIEVYNRKYVYGRDFAARVLFNVARSYILGINRYTFMSYNGALPIYDNKVTINLLPEWQGEFEKLGLKKYITVGSNGGNFARFTVKEWPTRYFVEFISLLKSKMPEIQVVQSGGGG